MRTILKVDVRTKVHLASAGLEDESSLSARRKWEFNLSVKTSWTKQSGIQGVRTVCRHDYLFRKQSAHSSESILSQAHLDIASLVEAIHLVEEFQQDTLNLSVSTCLGIETFRGDGIDLINEDDGR